MGWILKTFQKKIPEIVNENISIVGVYKVPENKDVYLIEAIVKNSKEIDFGKFTQENPKLDKLDWQVPYEEQYLNDSGTKLSQKPTKRFVFYFHFLNLRKSLITPYGKVSLKKLEAIPCRLNFFPKYTPID